MNSTSVDDERRRQMTVDVDGLAILAVAREVGDVVPTIQGDATENRIERAVEHQAGNVPVRKTEFGVGGERVAAVGWHIPIVTARGGACTDDRRATAGFLWFMNFQLGVWRSW